MKKIIIILSTLLTTSHAPCIQGEKALIFTYAYNRPDFIEMQYKTFKKFLKDEYDFWVFNDASNESMQHQIEAMCHTYGITCIRIPQEIHNRPYLYRWPGENFNDPAVRNSNVVQYSLDKYGFDHKGILLLLDSDMFLIRDLHLSEYMQNYDLAGVPQWRSLNGTTVTYLWIGLVFLKPDRLPNVRSLNFNCGLIGDIHVDTGGQTHHYLVNNPGISLRTIDHIGVPLLRCSQCKFSSCSHTTQELRKRNCTDSEIKFIQNGGNGALYGNNTFLHYSEGTNWIAASNDYHMKKTALYYDFINELLFSHDKLLSKIMPYY